MQLGQLWWGVGGPVKSSAKLNLGFGWGPTKHLPTAQTCQREKASIRLGAVNATLEPSCWDGTASGSGCVRVAGSGNDAQHACTTHHFDDNHHHGHHYTTSRHLH